MESRHATLGRRTLEEIRQRREAERLSKAASGPDLTQIPFPQDAASIRKSESGNRLSETDVSGLVTQLKDMQRKNTDLEEENRTLHTKVIERAEDTIMNSTTRDELNRIRRVLEQCMRFEFGVDEIRRQDFWSLSQIIEEVTGTINTDPTTLTVRMRLMQITRPELPSLLRLIEELDARLNVSTSLTRANTCGATDKKTYQRI